MTRGINVAVLVLTTTAACTCGLSREAGSVASRSLISAGTAITVRSSCSTTATAEATCVAAVGPTATLLIATCVGILRGCL